MTEEIKRKKGRPPLSPEEKAKRLEERKRKKREWYYKKADAAKANQDTQKEVNRFMAASMTQPLANPSTTEQKEIERLEKIMAEAGDKMRAQFQVPQEISRKVGNREEVFISRNKEMSIDDEYVGDSRPPFVIQDDKGWEETE